MREIFRADGSVLQAAVLAGAVALERCGRGVGPRLQAS